LNFRKIIIELMEKYLGCREYPDTSYVINHLKELNVILMVFTENNEL